MAHRNMPAEVITGIERLAALLSGAKGRRVTNAQAMATIPLDRCIDEHAHTPSSAS
jgi:hypothetical protein